MRVITGSARGCRLETLPGDSTRPTAEKVKESLFSAIQFDIEGRRVLDLFAGSGQLGIEALSRGAASCVFVDQNTQAVQVIRGNLQRAGLTANAQVISTDALTYLNRPKERFDLVFLDPPYKLTNAYADVVKRLLDEDMLTEDALIVMEHAKDAILPELPEEMELYDTRKYGDTCLSLVRRRGAEE